MSILDALAATQYSHDAGTSGTVTVSGGKRVTGITCYSSAGGTLTITPGGANQTGTAQTAITLPAGVPYSHPGIGWGQLGAGTILAFASTDSYVVTYAK